MVEPVSSIGAAAAATGTIIKVIQHGFAYTEVPDDVRVFQRSIESFNGTLTTTKRLRRVKSHLLDEKDKHEIDQNIQRAIEILDDISTTIEACRKDLSTKGTVSIRNRVLWLIRDHHTFMSRTHTLGICHQNLNCDINGMRQLSNPVQPPAYDSLELSGSLRPPSRRRPASVSKQPEMVEYELQDNSTWKSPSLRSNAMSESDTGSIMEDFTIGTPPVIPRRTRKSFMIT